jgi:hypothetical protein
MTTKELIEQDYGYFIADTNDVPLPVSTNRYWLAAQDQRKKVWHLTYESEKGKLR